MAKGEFMDDDVDEINKDEDKIWRMMVTGWRERMMIVLTRMKTMNMIVAIILFSNIDNDNDDGNDQDGDITMIMTNW